eukprot:gene33850-39474_t
MTAIGDSAFYGCSSLGGLVGNTVTNLALLYCDGVTYATVPTTFTSIPEE